MTYFEFLESLVSAARADGKTEISISSVEEAMIRDNHAMYHDAVWENGCSICDRERSAEG